MSIYSIVLNNASKQLAPSLMLATGLLGFSPGRAADFLTSSVIADSFKLVGARQVGSTLKGSSTEIGDLPWRTMGVAVLRQDGALTVGTAQSALAWVPLQPEVLQAPFKVQADCQVATTDWVGLSLGSDLGDFFKAAKISLILRPNGNYALFAGNDSQLWNKPLFRGKAANFEATGWNSLELEFDSTRSSLSASINGTTIAKDYALGEAFPTAQIQCTGVRFNETVGDRPPMQPNAPAVDNFAVTPLQTTTATPAKAVVQKTAAQAPTGAAPAKVTTNAQLEPFNRTQFFLNPNETGLLKWRVPEGTSKLSCEVSDYQNRPVLTQSVEVKNGALEVPLRLSPGFYELKFQPGDQTFGVMVSAPYQGAPDKFFAIDTALSWLETRPEIRTDLVALLKRSGIGLVRERMSWQAMNPQPEQWDFETNRQFDTLRQEYQRQGVKLLDVFHAAPGWTKIDAANIYPQRLAETKNSWQSIAKRWQSSWDALEVWNEPDIESGGEMPADQYLPVVKTLNYGLRESQSSALIGGGVFGYYNPAYIQNSVKNGLLDQVDFVSFHTYAKTPAMEQIISDYRRSLTSEGQTVPLWLTESGQPWKTGPARPKIDEDGVSALEITMKGIEARACGVARYFAFVYPYYPEGARNFGMMGQEVTPLRSMAAYVQSVSALSNSSYVGDLNLPAQSVQRARVFAQGDNAVVVLYAEKADANSSVAWNGPLARIQGIDGRSLTKLPNGAIPLPDGLTYVHTSLKSLTGLVRQTRAAQMTAIAKSARPSRPTASAIVLQPLLPATTQITKRGYKVAEATLNAFPLKVRVNNLSNAPQQLRLLGKVNDGLTLLERRIELAPLATSEVQWDVDLAAAFQKATSETVTLDVVAQSTAGAPSSSLSLELFREGDLGNYLRLYPASTGIDITDLTRWKTNISPTGQMKVKLEGDRNWQLQTSFKGGDRWVFPEFQLPQTTNWKGSSGLIVRARALAPATVRVMLKERNGATYFTPFSIAPTDGQWHALMLQWSDLAALPSAPPDPNGQLDLDQIASISLGMNSKSDENTLEVSDFYIAQKPTQLPTGANP